MQSVNYARGYVEISLDAIEHNIDAMRRRLNSETKMMLIIKADGYGHGAIPIAKIFEELEYIWGYGVATLDEGVVLRNAGIKKPILILGCVFPEQYMELLLHDLRVNVYNEEMAIELSKKAKLLNQTVYMHIKIDSGMSRLGFVNELETLNIIERISNLAYVELEGIFTHFSKADETDKTYSESQYRTFTNIIAELEERNIHFTYKHCCNSAGIIDLPKYQLDMVRAGISLYGLYPSDEVVYENVALEPVMSFVTRVASVKRFAKGTCISYGGTFVADKDMMVATIPIGYADGYARGLSNKGYVLIHGKKAPILGRVCMDQFMVDVTHIGDVVFQTPVTLFGVNKQEQLPVEVLSEISGKFNYEFVCGISKRIPRIYTKNKEIIEQIDYFA